MIGHRTLHKLVAIFARRPSKGIDPAARERTIVADSGLLDPSYYLIQGPDVRAAGADPADHFCRHGWREGRRPNPCFDPSWYRDVYLSNADRNPLLHYILEGEAANCRPIAYFDPAWYRQAYGLPANVLALRHYLEHRRSQQYAPNSHFDLKFYLGRYGSEIGPNRDPFAHLVRCGATRDLSPSASFDSGAYRMSNMGGEPPPTTLATIEKQVPLVHYLDRQARAAVRRDG